MNTNYDDEATQLVDTTSMTQETNNNAAEQENKQAEVNTPRKKSNWSQAAMGAASGLVIGSVSPFLMGFTTSEASGEGAGTAEAAASGNNGGELSNPEWVDDQVQVATSVNDDMSFGEAFATARAEVGAGGVFEWNGQIYNTFTAEEWNNMTAEERAEYSDHFNWNHIDHSTSDVAQYSTTESSSEAQSASVANDDIEVVSVTHDEMGQPAEAEVVQAGYEEVSGGESDVEILGVIHEDGMNYGGVTVGGEDVVLVDVDGDFTFDYMAVDFNDNGDLDNDELIDIQSEQLTVDDLGGFTNDPTGDMLASNDGPDYIMDAPYEA